MAEPHSAAAASRPALVLVPPVATPVSAPVAQPPAAPDMVPPPGVIYMPGESVLVLAVDLPPMPGSQRGTAAAYAIEDRIAQPLEKVHVVLGPEMPGRRGTWLVAIATRSAIDAYGAKPKQGYRLLPDSLALPVPQTGWAVWAMQMRILVRLSDGTGFATNQSLFQPFWAAAGCPPVTLYGGCLPDTVPIASRQTLPTAPDPWLRGFDLLVATRARHAVRLPRGWRAVLAIVVMAALGHLALLGADVLMLSRQATASTSALRAALIAEGQPAGIDIELALTRAMAARDTAPKSGFLPLLAKVFTAAAPQAGQVTLQDLRYEAASATASFTVEAPDLAGLQTLETALVGGGLAVVTGAATTKSGGAEALMTAKEK